MRMSLIVANSTDKTAVESLLTATLGDTILLSADGTWTNSTTWAPSGKFFGDLIISDAQKAALMTAHVAVIASPMRWSARTDGSELTYADFIASLVGNSDKYKPTGEELDIDNWFVHRYAEANPIEGGGDDRP